MSELKEYTLGSGHLHIQKYTNATLPTDWNEFFGSTDNILGRIKGGASFEYTTEKFEDEDDLGYVKIEEITKEKVQLIMVMSRRAKLYLLDEPIGGVDPATRDYILDTIIRNYDPEAVVLISTHLISDVEKVLDEVLFIREGKVTLHASVDDIRQQYGMSVDEYFREVFKC